MAAVWLARRVLSVALLLAVSVAAEARGESQSSACGDGQAVTEAIAKTGVAAAFKGRFDSEHGWNRLLSCIRTGQSAWLQVALQAEGTLDGGGPGEIAMAVGDALERNPARVLRLLRQGYSNARVVCGCEGIEDLLGSYEQAVATIRRRTRAVGTVSTPELNTERRTCLGELARLDSLVRQHAKDWYGR